jgi:high-affinity iron transporter
MLLSSVIIILREVLEAVLIISVFLAFNRLLDFSRRWLVTAVIFGSVGAAIYAVNMGWVSESMDGIGQELSNAALQLILYGLLLVFNITLLFHRQKEKIFKRILYICVTASVVFAITREGSEILIYLYGFMLVSNQLPAILIGGAIGAGIGLSVGIMFYYILANLSKSKLLPVGITVNILVGANMVSQATQQFIQADILPSQSPLWDSSNWIPEQSVTGQMLYALLGYEATPTPLQVIFYFVSIAIMLLSVTLVIWHNARKSRN